MRKTGVGGYRLLLSLNFDEDIQLAADQIVLGMFSFIPFLLLLLTGFCLIIDGKSSLKWSIFKVLKFDRELLRDIATISLITANVVVIECDDVGFAAVFLWLVTMLATIFFPPVILTILGHASGISEPTPMQIFCAGRCALIVSFSLRHAALVGFMGLSPSLDAALLLQLIRRNMTFASRYELVPISDGIWSTCSNEALYIILATRLSIWVFQTQLQEIPILTILATFFLLIINFLFHNLTLFGIRTGSVVFGEGRKSVVPGHLGAHNCFSVNGAISFVCWLSMLLLLAVAF